MNVIWRAFPMSSTRRAFCFGLFAGSLALLIAQMQEGAKIMAEPTKESSGKSQDQGTGGNQLEEATFGGGCFWCTEAVFQQLNGVKKVISGYSGGHTKNPTYKQICTGETGHAEVIRIVYDPKLVTYTELLEVFFKTHDPTTRDRQGNDVGTQYRSVIYYHNEKQHKLARDIINELDASEAFKKKIVTEVSPLKEFYPGEDYHQNYYRDNPGNPYCSAVIKYKVDKFRAVFKDKLKDKDE